MLTTTSFFSLTADECRKRWRTMRERYTRELKRYKSTDTGIKQECPPDAATANVSWSLFNDMSFLYDHVKLRKTRYTFEKSIKVTDGNEATMCDEHQLIDQNTSDATTAGQVYAKFKVQSVDGSDGESRILVNEEYKEYSQLQSVDRKDEATEIKCHESYVIINHCADISSGANDEHEVVVGEDVEDEEEEEEEEEFLTDETHHHQQAASSSGHRIILTAPRDNTPSPQPMPPPPLIHHHGSLANSTITVNGGTTMRKSLKRKGDPLLMSPTTTTMTIDPADHSEIVSVHHSGVGGASASHIHHVTPMHQNATMISGGGGTPTSMQQQDDNDFFGSAVSGSLRQLSRLHNIKAKVEIYKVLERFIELEDRK